MWRIEADIIMIEIRWKGLVIKHEEVELLMTQFLRGHGIFGT